MIPTPARLAILSVMPLFAHVSHWAVYLLYAVPVLIVLASIFSTVLRDRRERRTQDKGPA